MCCISFQNIADYLALSDAFCLSSIHEGMPITLIEALACGCIPICTPVGGMIDTITNGVTGFISKSISQEDYYQSMLEFINNKELIKKEILRSHYNENFSIEKCALNHLKLYLS